MNYRIRHLTHYQYQESVRLCHNRLCLMPLDNAAQNRRRFDLRILPEPSGLAYRRDFFGNTQIFFSNYQEHQELEI
ncbi:MAG: transglutaminase family protein, partial [Spirochaetia bacterium]|nr:transglutaminase family protein [Spirochaetia bacterium]